MPQVPRIAAFESPASSRARFSSVTHIIIAAGLAKPSEQELTAYCRACLAAFKVPRYWRLVETFPMTVTGKIQKFRLRQMAIELLNLQEAAAEKTA